MIEICALIEDWRDSARTRLVMDADEVARDPRLALVGTTAGARVGRRIFSRGASTPSTPEERYAEVCRRAGRSVEIAPSRMEDAAFSRVHLADLLLVGQALEHIRKMGKDTETINVIYVTDASWKLLDSLELRRFILNAPEVPISAIMDYSFIGIPVTADR